MKRKAFFIGNFLVLGLFLISLVVDANREWKVYAKEYKKLEIERAKKEFGEDSEQLKAAKARPIALKHMMAKIGRAHV